MKMLFGGHELILLPEGALFWPLHKMLVISDLHLEKGSHYAPRGFFLPPYDSHATLARADSLCRSLNIDRILILGDCFHDPHGYARLNDADRALFDLFLAYKPVWIQGNHDKDFVPWGFENHNTYSLDGLIFRHEAAAGATNEISGHFHPKADITHKGARISKPCFMEDGRKLIVPSFGAYTGGLSVTSPSLRAHFPDDFRIHVLGKERIYSFGS